MRGSARRDDPNPISKSDKRIAFIRDFGNYSPPLSKLDAPEFDYCPRRPEELKRSGSTIQVGCCLARVLRLRFIVHEIQSFAYRSKKLPLSPGATANCSARSISHRGAALGFRTYCKPAFESPHRNQSARCGFEYFGAVFHGSLGHFNRNTEDARGRRLIADRRKYPGSRSECRCGSSG
jgi:hypothetical protein